MRWLESLPGLARERLPPSVWEYFDQGAGRGISAAEAASVWDAVRFRPRALVDVSRVSTVTTVLGQQLTVPVLVAPTTLQRLATPEGELATARAARRAGSLMCVSSNAGTPFEQIGAIGHPWWVQAYLMRDRGLSLAVLERARASGACAVVLTADTPVVGTKHQVGESVWDRVRPEQIRVNIDAAGLPASTLDKADDLTPDTIGWLVEHTGLPVVVKGVLRGDDAALAVRAGARGVVVSNHGGRQLDQAIATARALPDVVQAVGADAEVLVDGGLRTSEHVLAALALGAQAVLLGRPVLWALAVAGEDGVTRLLDELRRDLAECLRLVGAPCLDRLGPDLLADR